MLEEKVYEIVIEKLDQILDDVSNLKIESAKQSKDIEQNTKDLSAHILGVQTNRRHCESLEEEIRLLKEQMSTSYLLKKIAIIFGTAFSLITAGASVVKIIENLLK